MAYPYGLAPLDELPEERSGEVMQVALGRVTSGHVVNTSIRVVEEVFQEA
jgi:hypothetical protein